MPDMTGGWCVGVLRTIIEGTSKREQAPHSKYGARRIGINIVINILLDRDLRARQLAVINTRK